MKWTYPALVARIGTAQPPSRAALRFLVGGMGGEAFANIKEPARRRQQIRRAIMAMLSS